MKKGSHLRKIAIVLSVLESNLVLFNPTDVKSVENILIQGNKVCKENNNKNCNELTRNYFLCEESVESDKNLKNREDNIVKCAYTLIGKPYVYGATGPDEFDCSGLTQYVYMSTGKNISRTTYTQVEEGVEISKKDLRPGDLVFFNTTGYMSHVGIYVGNESFIHAPRSGKPVMVSSLGEGYYCEKFATARRIIN